MCVCNVIMTFAVFIMFFIISRLSKLFNDHALGAIEEQSEIQRQIMETVQEETGSSTESVNCLYEASENIAHSMQNISASTERIVENIMEQTHMTQSIQEAISNTQLYSSEMVTVATVSNQEMLGSLKKQSEQIAENNSFVTELWNNYRIKSIKWRPLPI